ncbi:MAG TPA: FliI/YscN family ATPase [Verrucomicrobiae bacterium]|jgi:flagellum-specific ATP synthase|nr:FliI/YscN family ATPase [Verrucomicrobiae bacterium]
MTVNVNLLDPFFRRLEQISTWRSTGRVKKAVGFLIESEGPYCSVGECCAIVGADGREHPGEVVGFRGSTVLSMPLDRLDGLRFGDRVITHGARPSLPMGPDLLGRVIDGSGEPLDSLGSYRAEEYRPLYTRPTQPLDRTPIRSPLGCGIRAIDGMLTCGRGQRVGIFGGSGVGKSTLIGMMARGTSADLTVLALVGERGREVREFLEGSLGQEGLKRAVVVVATSDQSPLLRLRAALAATAIAEYFCSQNRHVLLVVDSLTRFAMAQREIGLAAGEPPTAKGYTPSVFSLLAQLVERAGHFGGGSITAFYSLLMEGDDQQDPLVDAVRALLDGHIILDRRLASEGHYPPIAILDSLSRLVTSVCTPEHLSKMERLRQLIAAYAGSEDLIRVGAYQRGTDVVLDKAIDVLPALNLFLRQKKDERSTFEEARAQLLALPG